MKTSLQIIFIVCVGSLRLLVLADTCIYKVCNCIGMFIYCNDLGLTAIPPLEGQLTGPLSNLMFDTNNITTIPAESLPSGLSLISLTQNPVKTIDDYAFNGSSRTLQTVTFAFAKFTRIPNALKLLKTLRKFGIYNTNIVDWNDNVMNSLGSTVQSLIISNMTLPAWPNWIQYWVHMTELSLINCNLAVVPDDGLDMVANTLVSLTLTGNSLTTVPKALSKLTVLEMLFLDENKITDTRWLPVSSKLSDLSLSNNYIFNATQLSQALRSYAASMNELDLINNKLTAIPDIHFLTSVGFDFSYNMISDPNSGALPQGLESLDLDHNLLPSIPHAVSVATSLVYLRIPTNSIIYIDGSILPKSCIFLDLGYNLITELTDTNFPPNSTLQTLYLNNNPIVTISVHAFQNLPNLVELFLANTKLTRLPLALSSLKVLNMFDISGTPDLVCTCLEKSLGHLLLSMPPDTLYGDCGRLSIQDFFSLLSPSCP